MTFGDEMYVYILLYVLGLNQLLLYIYHQDYFEFLQSRCLVSWHSDRSILNHPSDRKLLGLSDCSLRS